MSIILWSTKPIYKPSLTSLPVVKVSGGARSCLEWNFWMGLMSQVLDPRNQSFTTSGQVISKQDEHHLEQCWEKCLHDDAVVIPHRIIRLYNQKGDCTRLKCIIFLHREDDENDEDSTQDEEGTNADDGKDLDCQGDYLNKGEAGEDTDKGESGEEITGVEEVITSVVKDLSNDYSDDEDDDDDISE